jgi:HD-GYP domain-containing protein (c-di-GMP phosphodiesterase class II)
MAASMREPLLLADERDGRRGEALAREGVTSAMAVPVVFKDELFGVISLGRTDIPEPFSAENLSVLTSFAGQLAVSLKNARLYSDLENTFLGTISALAAAVDAKDPYTFGHSTEVTDYTDEIARIIGLSENERHTLHIAATLHDIGKIGIDSATLRKPGALNAEERASMERHPSIGADILAPLDFLAEAVPLILFHHERFGGGGYPSGISGSAIPLGARIITVADSFNAMVSDRPYRKGLPHSVARQELLDNSGTQFDPMVVAAFLPIIDSRTEGEPALRVVPTAGADMPPERTSHAG